MSPPEVARVVFVSGAARRLGRAIALGFADAGWDVAIHYGTSGADATRTAADITGRGRRATTVQADLADEDQVLAAFDAARDTLGPIGCVVNSASRFVFDRPEDFSYATLQSLAGPNLAAPLALARRLYETTDASARAVVVNLLDQKLENLNPDFFSYTLTKQALLGATRMMAMAFAPRVRVAAVSPGITLRSGDQTDEGFRAAHTRTPLGRSSTPDDIARAVRFLAESPAITGVNLIVDGGQHLLPLDRDVMYLP